jgi:hypothetical protein
MSDRNGTARPRIIAVGEEPPPMDGPAPLSCSCRDTPKARTPGQKKAKKGNHFPGTPKARARERFAVLNAFVDFALAELCRSELAVWLVLYRDTREGTARTSYDDIARRAGLNRRNVGRALRRLEALRLVEIVHRGGRCLGVSRYRVRGLPKEEGE